MGEDSGYASVRSLVWLRWPTSGDSGTVTSAADHDALVADLIASGTITDPKMVYFDVRPSAHLPTVELRVQALYGLDVHPTIGDGTPLLLALTSPAGHPIQTTADLPAFWRGSRRDVVKEMKGRYPRHRWPDQPWTEKPSLKTKNAFQRTQD
jgi:HrpA-like RNA helicase